MQGGNFGPLAITGGTPTAGSAINVTNAATLLAAANDNRRSVQFQNMGTATVYVGGGTAVSTTHGWPIIGAATWPAQPYPLGGPWYGIVASGTVAVRVLELG